ncbi:MAG: hypothetical protein K0Q73_6391 [Paenibacillus sp.]|nr:hypothetical protein [Paenibacillus sp.]
MSFEFRPCELEMDYDSYIKFLLQHHDELNLPYSFAMKLSFIGSPLILGKALLGFSEEPYQIVGATGFVYGTGANDYEDRHVCQVEVAFIQKPYRRTSLFLHGLKALVDEMKAGNPDIQQVQFWASTGQEELDRLFSKFSALTGSTRSIVNNLAFYTVAFHELESYCNRFRAA